MSLVIHDLDPAAWEKLSPAYAGWDIISDNGKIRPCCGCFCCWHKIPGECILKDGYDQMGRRIHSADEVVVISRYTYGGFSGFVKNVFDRSLGYVLPQFEIVSGESHHKKRYEENKPFTFIFYGRALSPEERKSARRYVNAVCTNIRGYVKEVIFREDPAGAALEAVPGEAVSERAAHETAGDGLSSAIPMGKVLLLNGSMRYADGNSQRLADKLKEQLDCEAETAALQKDPEDAFTRFEAATDLVLCVPLYVDGLPSQVIRFMERAEASYRGEPKRVYVLANMGLYESQQLVNLFSAVRQWCGAMGFEYGGGLGLSAGELIGTLIPSLPWGKGPTKAIAAGMKRLAEAVNSAEAAGEIYAEPWNFPRPLYIAIANRNWNRLAKRNGIHPDDLYRRLKKS